MVERFDDGIKVSPETARRLTEHKTADAFQEEYGAARPRDRNLPFPLPIPHPRPRPFTMDELIERSNLSIDSIENLIEDKTGKKAQQELEKAKPRLTPHGEQQVPKQTPSGDLPKPNSSKLQSMRNLFLPLEDILK